MCGLCRCRNITPPVISSQCLCGHLAVSPPLLFPGSWSNEQCREHSCTGAPGLVGAHYLNSQSQHITVGSSVFVPCHTWLDVSVDVWSEGGPFPASAVSKGDAKGGRVPLPQIVWGMGASDGCLRLDCIQNRWGKRKSRARRSIIVQKMCVYSVVRNHGSTYI